MDADVQKDVEPLDLVAHALFAFGLSATPLEIAEAWTVSAGLNVPERFVDCCTSLGLEGKKIRLNPGKLTSAQLPCLLQNKASGAMSIVLGENDDGYRVLSTGCDESTTYNLKELKKYFSPSILVFSLPDQDMRSAKARLRALNPLSSLGLSKITWVLVAALFSNILGLATSLFVMVVYDRVLPNRAVESLYALAIGVAIAVLFDSMLRSARGRLIENSSKAADVRVTEDLFDQYVAVANQKTRRSVGELANIMRDFETYREFMTTAMVLTFVDLPFVFLFILVIWKISSWLFLVPLIAILVVLTIVLGVQPLIAKSSRAASKSAQTRHGLLVEVLGGLDSLRVTGAYALMKHRFLSQARIHGQAIGRSKSYHQLVGTIVSTVQQGVQVGVIVLGFHLFVSQTITMGAIIAAVILSGRAMGPVARLGQTLGRANSALISYQNLKNFLGIEREDLTRDHRMPSPDAVVPALELSNVTLRLSENGPPLFSQLNLTINVGERVAVIGRTGSGKTSLVQLLNGLISPETGAVLIGGMPVNSIPRSHIHHRIGTVFQQPWLFSGTLRDNVSLGHHDIEDGALDEALQMAGLNNDGGDSLPLSMPVADQGANLSGGQRQAISLARAFAFRPAVYLLDEPSSAMDTQFENRLIQQITGGLSDRTFVIVTHKSQMLELCTRVIMMERGQIVKDMSINAYRASLAPKKAKVSQRRPLIQTTVSRPSLTKDARDEK